MADHTTPRASGSLLSGLFIVVRLTMLKALEAFITYLCEILLCLLECILLTRVSKDDMTSKETSKTLMTPLSAEERNALKENLRPLLRRAR